MATHKFALVSFPAVQRTALVDGVDGLSQIDEIELAGRVYRDEAGTLAIADTRTGNFDRDLMLAVLRRKLAVVLTRNLPARQRLVIVRRYFEDKQLPEIAQELHITLASVARLQAKALERLRDSQELREFLTHGGTCKKEERRSTAHTH